jgi:hypothetical protein
MNLFIFIYNSFLCITCFFFINVSCQARPHFENYLFSLLTGYRDAPHGVNLRSGIKHFKANTNHIFHDEKVTGL